MTKNKKPKIYPQYLDTNCVASLFELFYKAPSKSYRYHPSLAIAASTVESWEIQNRRKSYLEPFFDERGDEAHFYDFELKLIKEEYEKVFAKKERPVKYKVKGSYIHARRAFKKLNKEDRDFLFCVFHESPGKVPLNLRGAVSSIKYKKHEFDLAVAMMYLGDLTPSELAVMQLRNPKVFSKLKHRTKVHLGRVIKRFEPIFTKEVMDQNDY